MDGLDAKVENCATKDAAAQFKEICHVNGALTVDFGDEVEAAERPLRVFK